MGIRFAAIIGFFTLLYGALIFNLYNLQIKKGEAYTVKAETQLELAGLLEPVRGNIYFSDKKGNQIPAAINKNFSFVYAVPKKIEDVKEAVETLAPIIGKPKDFLETILSKPNDLYEPLITKETDEQIQAIKNANLKGIYTSLEPARFYPLNNLGSQVIGFVSTNNSKDNRPIGQYGVERFYNDQLFGKEGTLTGEVVKKSEPGEDISLTIDRNIQEQA